MATADPTGRAPSTHACIYWDESISRCGATDHFAEESISCYNEGLCDGFGTCRGCSKYDQGGLKYDEEDGAGGLSQTPFNLQVYNLRAQLQPCCNWAGSIGTFRKQFVAGDEAIKIQSITYPDGVARSDANGQFTITLFENDAIDENSLPVAGGSAVATRDGEDADGNPFPRVNIRYQYRQDNILYAVTAGSYTAFTASDNPALYVINSSTRKAVPIWKPKGSTFNVLNGEKETLCTVAAASPWQEGFTDDNPSAYGCNGAKAECPFYTGPRFTEVVDEKMDTGNRITAKQIMELRFYSKDWKSLSDPRSVWEASFSEPNLWAWVRKLPLGSDDRLLPGPGKFDDGTGRPLIQKVTITDFSTNEPTIDVGAAEAPSVGTQVVGGKPNYPTLIREIQLLSSSLKVLFPLNTTPVDPFEARR